jgi:glucosyl-dolichyl phosphate glucuronosyltransferase
VKHNVPASRGTWAYFRRRCYAEGLSKAIVSKLVGSDDGLSSEWDYTLKTLPLGALRGLANGLKGDVNGFRRSGAIIAGLLLTTFGYVRGRLAKATPEPVLVEVPPSA